MNQQKLLQGHSFTFANSKGEHTLKIWYGIFKGDTRQFIAMVNYKLFAHSTSYRIVALQAQAFIKANNLQFQNPNKKVQEEAPKKTTVFFKQLTLF